MSTTQEKSQKIAFDFFMASDKATKDKKIDNLKRGPRNLIPFEDNLVDFCTKRAPGVLVSPSPVSVKGVIERIIPRQNIIDVLDFFGQNHCLCVKICFGLDEHLNPQTIVSGSFVSADNMPEPGQVDSVYTYQTSSVKPRSVYFLNFGRRIAPHQAAQYLERFSKQAPLSDLHGYVLDVSTYRYFLADATTLGLATAIRLRFGMNHAGDPGTPGAESGRAQIMMLELAPADGEPGAPIYLCSSSIKDDDDPSDCPPRRPCGPPARL